jgi:GBP family porin
MKKSLLALAVLGAMASAAQAQTSVTLYGIVDGGVIYRSGLNAAGDSSWAFGSGIEATNRWGIRGSEDLGGGLSAIFGLENGFNLGNGVANGNLGAAFGSVNGQLFDRGANVGLKGSFGTVTLGRNWNPFVLSQVAVDSNNFSNFGSLNSLACQQTTVTGGAVAGTNACLAAYWTSNSISYTTPNFNGFSASALVGLGGVAGDNSAGRTVGLSGTYANGPLTVAAGYYDTKVNGAAVNGSTAANTLSGARAWHLGGKYNFGVATVSLEFANYRDPSADALANTDFWDLGGAIPVGPNGVVYLNYLRKKDKNFSGNNGHLYKIAYDHNFSKTTTAYVNLGFTRNSATGTMGLLNGGFTAAGQNQTALGVGLRKAF